ncbi:RNA binding protein [Malassezia pachydermatis]|uniref:Cytoplasmic protein n=1 Tax=Malassezia pachydermatis TaxID=77020 RepID=A0A0M8MP01_9BASI|nr:cytoplasmic protein [Malassezia pachydermatis]KOS15408.1 cytoplasmic protein [Malassezia pachydermatis]
MDLYLTSFSFPRSPGSAASPNGTSPTSASALSPDARVVGSRAGIAVPASKSLAPGASRPSLEPDAELDTHLSTSPFSSRSSPGGRRAKMHTDAVNEVCAQVMAAHQCIIQATPSGEVDAPLGTSPRSPLGPLPLSQSPSVAMASGALSTWSDSTSVPTESTVPVMGSAPILSRGLPRFSVTLSGTQTYVNEACGELLQQLPLPWTLQLPLPWVDLVDPMVDSSASAPLPLQQDVRERFDRIMQQASTMLNVAPLDVQNVEACAGMVKQRYVMLTIAGNVEAIEYARVQVLVMLDEKHGLHSDTVDIDCKHLHVGAGRKRAVIQQIERESGASLYLPTPFGGVLQSHMPPAVVSRRNTVYVTGSTAAIARARELLQPLATNKGRSLVSRQVALMPRKLDWLLQERLESLRELMLDNSTYLELPVIGGQQGQVTVYGVSRVDVERSIRILMQLVSPFYTAQLFLLPGGLEALGLASNKDPRAVTALLSSTTGTSGADVSFHTNAFEIHGTDSEVRTALRHLLRQPNLKHYAGEVRFQLELATDHREFISGKKNGKINKIMEGCAVRIRFEPFNDYNFLIDVHGREAEAALQGLSQLQEELPAEMSFHVPESYHKRIIGVGGKNIQRIMKKFGVYVKFSNAEEFAALGGYIDINDNVIARTPSKNAPNLENLKNSVMELVSPKDKDFVTETVSVPRKYHRTLLADKSQILSDIEHRTRCTVRLARKESALDTVLLFGPESQMASAVQILLQQIPVDVEWSVANSHEMATLLDSPGFQQLVERIRADMGIELQVASRAQSGQGECTFAMELPRGNLDKLSAAKGMMEELCTKQHVRLHALPMETTSVPEPFSAAVMPPFSTSRFSPSKADGIELSTSGSSALYDEPHLPASSPAAVTPTSSAAPGLAPPPPPGTGTKDLKALFDQPDAASTVPFEGTNTNTPLMSPFYTPGYAESTNLSSQVWGAPLPSFQDMGPPAPKSTSMFSPFSSGPIPFSFAANDSSLGKQDTVRPPTSSFHSQSPLRRSEPMNSRSQGVDVGNFSAPLSRTSLSVRSPSDLGTDIDGFHAMSDATSRSSLGMMGPPGSAPAMPRGPSLTMQSRSSISPAAPSDTMDEVSRVLAQIAFDKQ